MKILFDHQAYTMQKYGGISRYFTELMKHFGAGRDIEFDLALKYSDNIYLEQIKYSVKRIKLPDRFKGKSTLLSLLNEFSSIKKIKEHRFDLFHPTYYNPYFLKYIDKHPFVLTVHDMTHELFPDRVNRHDKSAEYKRVLAAKASKIICVSENTRKDLCGLLNISEGKTEVIYHGSSLKKPLGFSPFLLPKKYILYVGTRGYYKNFDSLYTAVEPLLKEDKELHLLCAGGGKFNAKEISMIRSSGLNEKVLYKEVNDETLPYLYRQALVFVFPSLYEGFGIPILEAFNCDCPVITSSISSLPEVAGDSALYIDPKDPHMIRETVHKVINEASIREKLIQLGRIRREIFSWEDSARQTAEVYKSI